MSRTGLYGCQIRFLLTILWELVILVWEFYMLKSNIDVFFVTSFLCSLKFLLFHRIEDPKRCLWKNIEIFLCFSFCDMTSKSNVPSLWPWPLTHEGPFFQWIEYNPISILYKFQIDISSNSREVKYQNIGRHTDRHTHTQTGWKQYLATPSGGEVTNIAKWYTTCVTFRGIQVPREHFIH